MAAVDGHQKFEQLEAFLLELETFKYSMEKQIQIQCMNEKEVDELVEKQKKKGCLLGVESFNQT